MLSMDSEVKLCLIGFAIVLLSLASGCVGTLAGQIVQIPIQKCDIENGLSDIFVPTNYNLNLVPMDLLEGFIADLSISLKMIKQKKAEKRPRWPACFGSTNNNKNTSSKYDPRRIVMHSDGQLEINQVFVVDSLGTEHTPTKICYDDRRQLIAFEFKDKFMPKREITFAVRYFRSWNNGCLIRNSNDWVTTYTVPTFARHLMPCFDDPKYKTTFEISTVHHLNSEARSNMDSLAPVQSAYPHNVKVKTIFKQTPPLATHQIGLVIGDLQTSNYTCQTPGLGVEILASQTGQAMQMVACESFDKVSDYFKLNWPFERIYLALIPNYAADIHAGLGLVMMKESLFGSIQHDHVTDKMGKAIPKLVAALVQQYLGAGLISEQSWTDAWLTRGISTWLGYELIGHKYADKFDCGEMQFAIDQQIVALDADADVKQTKPKAIKTVLESFKSSNNVKQLVEDDVWISKSGALVRMLSYLVGRQKFDQTLSRYVNEHKNAHLIGCQVLAMLQVETEHNLQAITNSWLDKPGHPLVIARLSLRGKPTLSLEQVIMSNETKRFQTPWIIPVSILVSDGKNKLETIECLMDKFFNKCEMPNWFDWTDQGQWFKLNANFAGFYRVLYSVELLNRLKVPVESKQLAPLDRVNLISDSLALFIRDKISVKELQRVISWFEDEDDAGVVYFLTSAARQLALKKRVKLTVVSSILLNYYKNISKHSSMFGVHKQRKFMNFRAYKWTLAQLAAERDQSALEELSELLDRTNVESHDHLRLAKVVVAALKKKAKTDRKQIDGITRVENWGTVASGIFAEAIELAQT